MNRRASLLLNADILMTPTSDTVWMSETTNPFTFPTGCSERTNMTVSESQSLVSRRPHSQRLKPLRIKRPQNMFDPVVDEDWARTREEEVEEDVEEGAQQLFSDFVQHQMKQTDSPAAFTDIEMLARPITTGAANPRIVKVGRDLRRLADIFARSRGRKQVAEEAEKVSTDITEGQFNGILGELFSHGGITQERIVVLFFFCTDVAVRALRKGIDLCSRFLQWSVSFIKDRVCAWVRSCGGWAEVMNSSFNSLPKVVLLAGAFVFGFCAVRYLNR